MGAFSWGHASPTSLGGCSPLSSREPPAPPRPALLAGHMQMSPGGACPPQGPWQLSPLALRSSGDRHQKPDPRLDAPRHLPGPLAPKSPALAWGPSSLSLVLSSPSPQAARP